LCRPQSVGPPLSKNRVLISAFGNRLAFGIAIAVKPLAFGIASAVKPLAFGIAIAAKPLAIGIAIAIAIAAKNSCPEKVLPLRLPLSRPLQP
jgi:hypothetical protein